MGQDEQRLGQLPTGSLQVEFDLANQALVEGRLGAAIERYRRVLALHPDFAEAISNLGVALAGLGRWEDAATQYRRALKLRPDLVDIYRNLGRIVLAQGDTAQALALMRRAIAIRETGEGRAFFVQCVRGLRADDVDDELRELIARALAEGWSRPGELAAVAAHLCSVRITGDLATVAGDKLLLSLLTTGPVPNVELERFLTTARKHLLEFAVDSPDPDRLDERMFDFFCALARQCFINEYLFAATEDEVRKASHLREVLVEEIARGRTISELHLTAVAAYYPLHRFAQARSLLDLHWRAPLRTLIEEQVREPMEEDGIRRSIPTLTTIEDEVSIKVQRQYEEMPYPRWLKAAPAGRPVTLGWYLRNQFPSVAIRDSLVPGGLDVLIAGCGTGQHAIEVARRFVGARVLAIDLSRTSLAYAIRKTRELRIANIEYAQADILRLGSLGRTFDLIEAVGVLHHLRDWSEGWRSLLSLLRPGGFMHMGLYSGLARADIRAARAFIIEHRYRETADDIRKCRQEFLKDGSALKGLSKHPDFFTMSECRDLLFHVQEHQLSIPAIQRFLDENRLAFIGFTGAVAQDYRSCFPQNDMADLDQWHHFEMQHPLSFVGMYQFWLQKPLLG